MRGGGPRLTERDHGCASENDECCGDEPSQREPVAAEDEVRGYGPERQAQVRRRRHETDRLTATGRGRQVRGDGQDGDRVRGLPGSGDQPDRDDTLQGRLERERDVARDHRRRADDDQQPPAAAIGQPPDGWTGEDGRDARRADGDPDPEAPAPELVRCIERQHHEDEPEGRKRREGAEPDANERTGDQALRAHRSHTRGMRLALLAAIPVTVLALLGSASAAER